MKTGIGLAIGACILVATHAWNGGSAGDLLQPAALAFVIFGTFLSTLISGNSADFFRAFTEGVESVESRARLRKELSELASVARKDGLLALDPLKAGASRTSLREGIQYLVSGFENAAIAELFEARIERRAREKETSVKVWEIAAQAAPSVGALGATLGLLSALTKLDDPAALGRGIASAMASVLYGFFFANFVFAPLAARKRRALPENLVPEEMVKTAILGIQEGLSPHLVEERLKRFSESDRK